MKHRIIIGAEVKYKYFTKVLIKKSIRTALEAEGVGMKCEINVLLTDDEGIRRINSAMRGVDEPTDVLSFPMFELREGAFDSAAVMPDTKTGRVALGDIALNLDRVREQGEQFGHGERRETAYLIVHSVLHLLGYDHLDEGERKKRMRSREEEIMKRIKL
jgi:probable rRNA maturation factor